MAARHRFSEDVIAVTDVNKPATTGQREPDILFVDQTGALGGGEMSLLDIVRNASFHSTVVTFTDGPFIERLQAAGIPALIMGNESVRKAGRGGGLLGLLRVVPGVLAQVIRLARFSRRFDLVYANSQKAFVICALATVFSRRPLVWHLRDILSPDHFSQLLMRVVVFLANRRANAVIANSQATADSFLARGGRREILHIVYNGIDVAPFDGVSDADIQAARQGLAEKDQLLIGFFGRISPWKGQHIVLSALPDLPGFHLAIVGGALFGEDAYEAELRELAARLGVADRVAFLGFRSDIPLLMRASDIIVHASTSAEPFGRVILEGMLARRPVIASEAGGALEIVENGKTGILTPCADVPALTAALKALADDERLRHMLAEAGYQSALSRFSVPAMCAGVAAVIRQVLSSR